jgi:flagellar basal-body rod protein FlgB
LASATEQLRDPGALRVTNAAHIDPASFETATQDLAYRTPHQASLDGNTVDAEAEKAEFARNTLQYQVSLKFLDGKIRTLMSALRGE